MLLTKVPAHTFSCPCSQNSLQRSWWHWPTVSSQLALQQPKDTAHDGTVEPVVDVGSALGWFLPAIFLLAPPERKGIYVSEALNPNIVIVSLCLSFPRQLWQLAWTQWNSWLKEKRKSWENVRDKQKDLSPPLIHFPAAVSSCWPVRFNSWLFLCISQFFVWRSLSFLNLSTPATFLLWLQPLPTFPSQQPKAGLAAPLETHSSIARPPLLSHLPFPFPFRLGWIHWMDEVRIKLHGWLQPGPCIPAQHTQIRYLQVSYWRKHFSFTFQNYPSPGSLDRVPKSLLPWADFLPQEFHQQASPLQFP